MRRESVSSVDSIFFKQFSWSFNKDCQNHQSGKTEKSSVLGLQRSVFMFTCNERLWLFVFYFYKLKLNLKYIWSDGREILTLLDLETSSKLIVYG